MSSSELGFWNFTLLRFGLKFTFFTFIRIPVNANVFNLTLKLKKKGKSRKWGNFEETKALFWNEENLFRLKIRMETLPKLNANSESHPIPSPAPPPLRWEWVRLDTRRNTTNEPRNTTQRCATADSCNTNIRALWTCRAAKSAQHRANSLILCPVVILCRVVGDSLWRCGDSLSRCGDSLSRCGDSLSRCGDSLLRCDSCRVAVILCRGVVILCRVVVILCWVAVILCRVVVILCCVAVILCRVVVILCRVFVALWWFFVALWWFFVVSVKMWMSFRCRGILFKKVCGDLVDVHEQIFCAGSNFHLYDVRR